MSHDSYPPNWGVQPPPDKMQDPLKKPNRVARVIRNFALLFIALFVLMMAYSCAIAMGGAGSDALGVEPTLSAPREGEAPAEVEMTNSQEQAVKSAQQYLDFAGFSKFGLMQQLTSDAGAGFQKADATFALKHVEVDWNAEAVQSAQSYLNVSSFSRSALIEQLSSKYGAGFTLKQATYAVNKVGL